MANNILITGAASPIGRYVCNRLAKDFPEATLIGTYSRTAPEPYLPGMRWIPMDLLNHSPENSIAEVGEVQNVVHLASLTPGNNISGENRAYYQANVHGIMAVLKALQGSLQRVFYLSSSSVYNRTKGDYLDELSEKSHEDHYGLSKLMFERELATLHAHRKVHSLGLRVPVLLTEGVKYNFLSKWKTAIAAKKRLTLANPDAPFNAVCADFALYEACRSHLQGEWDGHTVSNIFAPQATTLRAILDRVGYTAWDEVDSKVPAQQIKSLHTTLCFPHYDALEVASAFLS